MKQAILLLSNRTDYSVRDRYDKLIKDYGHKAEIYLLFDATKGYNKQELVNFEHVYPFNVNTMIDDGYTALKEGFLGNCHYPVLAFHKEYPEYDYLWIVEDDVFFSGDWSVLFDTFTDDPADLIATKIRCYEEEPTWYWWKSMRAGMDETISKNIMYACFIPIYRLSAKAIDCLYTEVRNGWRGHFEGVVPTVLIKNGLTLRDMNGKGFGLNERVNLHFYSDSTHNWSPLYVQSFEKNMIYHPIKQKVSKITYQHYCLLSVVGEHSRHIEWITGNVRRNYDVHLIVNDMSFGKHYDDADFVYGKTGRKVELIKDYFNNHNYLLKEYDYFFLIDEMCGMNVNQINELFKDMAQDDCEFSIVGMTMPCLRQDTMIQVLEGNPETSILFF
ncbi:MAG: hypothetical protein J5525_10725 [Lachnospiraceae bacterium]|nr:hypothetical protein [Lachnospiraceae bacterium]